MHDGWLTVLRNQCPGHACYLKHSIHFGRERLVYIIMRVAGDVPSRGDLASEPRERDPRARGCDSEEPEARERDLRDKAAEVASPLAGALEATTSRDTTRECKKATRERKHTGHENERRTALCIVDGWNGG